jgi:hypothetical protein
MDDSFAFRTTVPIRRRPDPLLVKAAIALGIVALLVGIFASWVASSERRSFARADHRDGLPSEVRVDDVGDAGAMGAVGEVGDVPSTLATPTDGDAQEALDVAATAARAIYGSDGSFLAAGPAQLSAVRPEYVFVDGPSTMPRIVSVAAEKDLWAAAVAGADGSCVWTRIAADGSTVTGTASECTGSTAMRAIPNGGPASA